MRTRKSFWAVFRSRNQNGDITQSRQHTLIQESSRQGVPVICYILRFLFFSCDTLIVCKGKLMGSVICK